MLDFTRLSLDEEMVTRAPDSREASATEKPIPRAC